MNEEQLHVLAKLLRARPDIEAAVHHVLIKGETNSQAALKADMSRSALSNALTRFKTADDLIRQAYCPAPENSKKEE
jgi:hypothetical protein